MHRTNAARRVLRASSQVAWLAAAMFAVLLTASPSLAQQPAQQDPAGQATEAKPAAKPKFRGRLPAYYSRVVSQDQRTKIYDIQAKFAEQIAKLEQQMRDMETARAKEVRDVLTAEQKKQVDAMLADAKARRASRTAPAPEPEPAGATGGNAEGS